MRFIKGQSWMKVTKLKLGDCVFMFSHIEIGTKQDISRKFRNIAMFKNILMGCHKVNSENCKRVFLLFLKTQY